MLFAATLVVANGSMPQLPILDKQQGSGGLGSSSAGEVAQQNTPFKLSQLDLGSISMKKRPAGKKRAAAAAAASRDDDEDPREEAQVQALDFVKVTNTLEAAKCCHSLDENLDRVASRTESSNPILGSVRRSLK